MSENKLFKLKHAAGTNNWEYFERRKKSEKYDAVRIMVCDRHDHQCKFCGYQGNDLEIINLDGDYKNNHINNLAPACIFCTKPQFLDFYSLDYEGEDKMIYFPHLNQSELSSLYRGLFYNIAKGGDDAYNAKMIYSQLKDQAIYLDEQLGVELSHPGQFLFYFKSAELDPEFASKVKWLPSLDLNLYEGLADSLVDHYELLLKNTQ